MCFVRLIRTGLVDLSRTSRPWRARCLAACALAVSLLAGEPPARGADAAPAAGGQANVRPVPPELDVTLDDTGNARVEYLRRLLPSQDDATLPATAALEPDAVRGLLSSVYRAVDVVCLRDHAEHTVTLRCDVPGMARPRSDGKWELRLPKAFDAASLGAKLAVEPAQVVLSADPDFPAAYQGVRVCRIRLPQGSTKAEFSASDARLRFQMPPRSAAAQGAAGPQAQVDFHFDVQPQLISCVAKSYAYERLDLWLARASIKNTGSQPLTNYRVRFRLKDFASDWTQFSSPTLLPGQTIVDAYFPILDLDKIGRNEGTRATLLEVEYEYTKPDGTVVSDMQSGRLDVLGHNQVSFGKRDRDVLPIVMASFATKDDRIIRRVAAMVTGQVPGGINQSNREGTLQFMRELYRFMIANRFAYTIPPGEAGLQHVKFGRDVVLDRSGTCIDLAIFYASVCEAVGMETRLYVRLGDEGHCFPAVRVPAVIARAKDANGNPVTKVLQPAYWQAVETTQVKYREIAYETAAAKGEQERADWEKLEPHNPGITWVDVATERMLGIHSLELPSLDEGALQTAGIAAAPPDIVGYWINQVNNVRFFSEFRPDGQMLTIWKDTNTGQVLYQGAGRYTYDGRLLTYSFPNGSQEAEVSWTDATHINYRTTKSTIPGAAGVETVMTRVQQALQDGQAQGN